MNPWYTVKRGQATALFLCTLGERRMVLILDNDRSFNRNTVQWKSNCSVWAQALRFGIPENCEEPEGLRLYATTGFYLLNGIAFNRQPKAHAILASNTYAAENRFVSFEIENLQKRFSLADG